MTDLVLMATVLDHLPLAELRIPRTRKMYFLPPPYFVLGRRINCTWQLHYTGSMLSIQLSTEQGAEFRSRFRNFVRFTMISFCGWRTTCLFVDLLGSMDQGFHSEGTRFRGIRVKSCVFSQIFMGLWTILVITDSVIADLVIPDDVIAYQEMGLVRAAWGW